MLHRRLTPSCIFSALLAMSFSLSVNAQAGEKDEVKKIPNDVSYMLEDMYGQDKQQWPNLFYNRDVNHDGLADWIAQKKSCATKKNCPADIFICISDGEGKCAEYCYKEVKTLINLEARLKKLKCESSC
jgi:hypothetical protein